MPGYLPSTAGLRFGNSFASVPLRTFSFLGIDIPIGRASNGLCGGMCYAARDYFEAGSAPPADLTPPVEGPLFDYLVDRLFDSFNLPLGPARYLRYMNPALRDGESFFSLLGLASRGRAWVMLRQEWPKIKAEIDVGRPTPIGLVTVKSRDPMQLGQNHVVLAYGYEAVGAVLRIRVYDPNFEGDDAVAIALSTADPKKATEVTYTGRIFGGDQRIWCFFQTPYSRRTPPI